MNEEKPEQLPTYKILIIGDSSVGKTNFSMRYTDKTFQEIHMTTIGLEFTYATIKLRNDKSVRLQIVDTAGQERFRAITKNFYRGANGIMVMYDVTNLKSFQNVNNWVSQIKEGSSGNPVVYLLGNKIDDVDNKKVKYEEGDELAKKLGIKFFETSAKDDKNVTESFENMAEDVYKTFGDVTESQQTQKVFKSNTGEENKVKKKCC